MAKFDLKNATVKFKDGGAEELEIKVGEGTLTFSEKRTMEYSLDRGLLDTVREGDEVPVDVRIDLVWEFLTADTAEPPTPHDVLHHRGEAADWVSSSDDTCEPFAIDIEITYEPVCGATKNEVILITDFRWESIDGDAKAGTLAVTGKSNATTVTPTRVAAAS